MSSNDEQAISFADLERIPANEAALARVRDTSAHGDLTEVVHRYVPGGVPGLAVVPVGDGDFPAVVVASRDGAVVAFATGMRLLALRVESPPDGARLEPEPLTDLGPRWWAVNPFAAEVSIPDTATELRAWFSRVT